MAIYNLEETPDIFITPQYYGNEFEYAMVRFNGEGDKVTIRVINLRNDKLMIYGTEVKESSSKRLYESLVIRPRVGIMYYNCDGACYFRIDGKGVYRPIHNVIFDWSAFGVTIPNSMNGILRNQLEQKKKEIDQLNHQLSSTDVEMLSMKANLKVSMEKVEKLEGQLSTYKEEQKNMEVKLQEACQRVALVEFELELYKIDMESYKKGEEELIDQLYSCKEKSRNMEIELQKVQAQLFSVNCELQSTKIELETSSRCTKEFEYQLSTCIKESQELERELKRVEKENTSITFELGKTKSEQQLLGVQLQKAHNHLCTINYELMSTDHKLDQLSISKLWDEVEDNCLPFVNSSSTQSAEYRQHSSVPVEEYHLSISTTEIM